MLGLPILGRNKPEELHLAEDIIRFRDHCINGITSLVKKFQTNKVSPSDYRTLNKLCLARALTYNARRGGEVSKLSLRDWDAITKSRWKKPEDIKQLTDPVERKLAERLQVVYVEGKKRVVVRVH